MKTINGKISDIDLCYNWHFNCVTPNIRVNTDQGNYGFMCDICLSGPSGNNAIEIVRELCCKLTECPASEITYLNDLKGVPVRLFINDDNRAIGIGHFLDDNKRVMKEDFISRLKEGVQ